MKPHISLTSAFAAVMLFAITVAMHEAARADSLLAQGVSPVAERLVTKHGKKPLGFKGSGGTSRTESARSSVNVNEPCVCPGND